LALGSLGELGSCMVIKSKKTIKRLGGVLTKSASEKRLTWGMFCIKNAGRRYRLVPSAAGSAVGALGCGGGASVAGGRAAVAGGRSAVVAGGDGDGDGGTLLGLLELGDLDGLADSLKGDVDDLQGRNSIGGGESSGATAGLGAQDDLAHLLQDLRVNILTLVA
jgi:hypothetical protein